MVTAPNVVSMRSIAEAVKGRSPYVAGDYRPWSGTLGRHNREYTPQEVEDLCRFAGIEAILLDTVEVDPQVDIEEALLKAVNAHKVPLELRGQQIVYVGRKSTGVAAGPVPGNLFAADPRLFDGQLELEQASDCEGRFVVRITNRSPLTWSCAGRGRVRLAVDRIDASGAKEPDYMSIDLPNDVAPGHCTEVPIETSNSAGFSWFEIGLHADGLGPFKATGRSPTVSVYGNALKVGRTRGPVCG